MGEARWSRGTLIHLDACPACGASLVAAEYSRRDDGLAMPDVWRMVKCGRCRSIYLADRPDDESLPYAYADYYTHQADNESATAQAGGLLDRLINGYLNERFGMSRPWALKAGYWLFRALPPLRMKLDVYCRHVPAELCNRSGRLLDVGCGNGAFLLRAREMGLDVHGCEPDPMAVATCGRLGLDVRLGDVWTAGFPDAAFDYITLNHVIEHVSDPGRLLAKLRVMLKPGGILWLGLPNPDALGLSALRQGWKGLHPPFHLVIPSQAILSEWLRKAGFTELGAARRGMQSPGLWRESISIARREGVTVSGLHVACIRGLGDLLSSVTPRWGEETIVIAR